MSDKPARRSRQAPQRTCIACRRTTAKRELVRIVRTPEGTIEVDPTGKRSGRGAYVCASADCWGQALNKDRLSSALRGRLSQGDRERLRGYAESLPATSTV